LGVLINACGLDKSFEEHTKEVLKGAQAWHEITRDLEKVALICISS